MSSIYLLRKIISRHKYTATVVGLLLVIVLSALAISLQLYQLSEDRRRTLEKMHAELVEQSMGNYREQRQFTFLAFLETWRENNISVAATMAKFIADDNSKEKKGAKFLLQSVSTKQSEKEFFDSLGDEGRWFADFVLAEKCMRDGRREQAGQLYRTGYQAMRRRPDGGRTVVDRLFEGYVKTRLLESVVSDRQMEALVTGQYEGDGK